MNDKELLKAIKEVGFRLELLIKRNEELEKANKYLSEMYEQRVNECLKLKEKENE